LRDWCLPTQQEKAVTNTIQNETRELKDVHELNDEQLEIVSAGSFWRDLAAGVIGGAVGGILVKGGGGTSSAGGYWWGS